MTVNIIYSQQADESASLANLPPHTEAEKNLELHPGGEHLGVPENLSHPSLGEPGMLWEYRDTSGQLVVCAARFDKADGGKIILPCTHELHDGQSVWRWKKPAEIPLYNSDLLAKYPEKPVVVCEGEKAADAAAALLPAYIATTSFGGSQSPHKTDWSIVRERDVVIWPDNDLAGFKYALKVRKILEELTG